MSKRVQKQFALRMVLIMLVNMAYGKEFMTIPLVTSLSGVVCPVGVVQGAEVSKVIGTEGGTITSADGRVQVFFPAGVLSDDITVEVQPISNTNPAGYGQAYRLSPHGIQFKKPVTITFSYAAKEGYRKERAVQGIAYQDDAGVWQSIGGGQIDTLRKTVSIQSTHFSDWSNFESMRLEPSTAIVSPGETLTLRAVQYFNTEDLILPLSGNAGTETPLGQPFYLFEKDIKSWRLSGSGSLTQANSHAVYKAPATITGIKSTAAVSVQLNTKKGQVLLISGITIINDGIVFRIDGGQWIRFKQAECGYNDLPEYVYTEEEGSTGNVSISWEKKGTAPQQWNTTVEGLTVCFAYHTKGNFLNYYSLNTTGVEENEIASPGYVQVSHDAESQRQYVSGEFIVERAALYDALGEKISDHIIEGFFCVRKVLDR